MRTALLPQGKCVPEKLFRRIMRQLLERQRMGRAATPLEGFWDRGLPELFQLLQATPGGVAAAEASRRLRRYGPNSLVEESHFAVLFSFFRFFANPLVIILIIASGVSLALGENVGGLILIVIVLLSG